MPFMAKINNQMTRSCLDDNFNAGDGDRRESVKRPASQGEVNEIAVSTTMSRTMIIKTPAGGVTSSNSFLYVCQGLVENMKPEIV